jgi:hypothetical protein
MCGTIDLGSCIRWVLDFGVKTKDGNTLAQSLGPLRPTTFVLWPNSQPSRGPRDSSPSLSQGTAPPPPLFHGLTPPLWWPPATSPTCNQCRSTSSSIFPPSIGIALFVFIVTGALIARCLKRSADSGHSPPTAVPLPPDPIKGCPHYRWGTPRP